MAGILKAETASILIRLIDCLEGSGPFTGLWTTTLEYLVEQGYTEEEIEKAIDELYTIAGLSR